MGRMPQFLIETYIPRDALGIAALRSAGAALAAAALTSQEKPP